MEKQENIKKTKGSKQVNSSESSDKTIWFRAYIENVGWSGWCHSQMSEEETKEYLYEHVENITDLIFSDRDLNDYLDDQKIAKSISMQIYEGWVTSLAKERDDFFLNNWGFEKVPEEPKKSWEHKRRKRPWEK